MPIDAVLPKLFAAAANRAFYAEPTLTATSRNWTAEAGTTKSFSIPDFTTASGKLSTADYAVATDIGHQRLEDAKHEIQVNKYKEISVYNDDLETTLDFRGLNMEAAIQMSQLLRNDFEKYVWAQLAGASGPTADINIAASVFSGKGVANNPKKAQRDDIVGALADAQIQANKAGYPQAGRVALMSYEWLGAISEYLAFDVPQLGAGGLVDSAFAEGRTMRAFGWELVGTPGAAELAKSAKGLGIACVVAGQTVNHILHARTVETMRDPDRFGDILKALYMYGAVVIPKKLIQINATVANAN